MIGVLVFSGKTARELLRRGFKIIDIKANKQNTERTIFVFQKKKGIIDNIIEIEGDVTLLD